MSYLRQIILMYVVVNKAKKKLHYGELEGTTEYMT